MSLRYEVECANLRARLLPNVPKTKIRQENALIVELFDKFPDQRFWQGLTPPFAIETFADLFSPKGRAFLKRAWSAFTFEPPAPAKRYPLSAENFGKDRTIAKKPRTIREFLNG